MKMRVFRILGLTIVAAVSGSGVLYGQTMSLKDCMDLVPIFVKIEIE